MIRNFNIFYSLIIISQLYYFSEGKSCPETYRPHKTRCDSYFKCIAVRSANKKHIWIVEKCDRGLIFEPQLKYCVLPNDDWECNLGDENHKLNKSINLVKNDDDNNVYGVRLQFNNLLNKSSVNNEPQYHHNKESEIHKRNSIEFVDAQNDDGQHYLFDVSNKLANSNSTTANDHDIDESYESSGGGNDDGFMVDVPSMELKEELETFGGQQTATTSFDNNQFDPKLTQHLQRLAQLIDGLKETYQHNSPASSSASNNNKEHLMMMTAAAMNHDLRPDQLNAFLAHYNIKSGFDAIDPGTNHLNNGEMESNVLNQVLRKQQNITDNLIFKILANNNSSHIKSNKHPMSQITKVTLNGGGDNPKGYSQIVVNRPEGSVLFSLQSKPEQNDYNSYRPVVSSSSTGGNRKKPLGNYFEYESEPRISEETLKTVLELSKQMVANQNLRQILPNNGYYQPILQPMYYPVPIPSYQHHQPPAFTTAEEKPLNYGKKGLNTIMTPVQISSNSDKGIIQRPDILNEPITTTARPVDSYGNQISHYVDYPSFLSPPIQQIGHHSSHQQFYQNSKYDITTEKSDKFQQSAGPQHVTISNYYTPNPHLDNSNANSMYNIERYPTVSPYEFPPNRHYYNQQQQQQSHFQSSYQTPSNRDTRPPLLQSNQNYNQLNVEHQQSAEFEENQPNYDSVVNEQFMTNLLTPKLDQQQHKQQQQQNTLPHGQQLVKLGGTFINYDIYKNQMLSAFSDSQTDQIFNSPNNLEVITCVVGVRQPNTTDCTKYYVCSKADSNILTYSCPPYTAFNSNTKICDAQTYSICNPQAVFSRYTVNENRRIQLEAMKALQEAKRIRDEAVQAQNFAKLIRLETEKVYGNNSGMAMSPPQQNTNTLFTYLNSNRPSIYQQQMSEMTTTTTTTTRKPIIAAPKRRKYYCKEGDKVADQTSMLNYYVCYKTPDGVMKGHKMTCSAGLMFCSNMKLCTLPKNCNA